MIVQIPLRPFISIVKLMNLIDLLARDDVADGDDDHIDDDDEGSDDDDVKNAKGGAGLVRQYSALSIDQSSSSCCLRPGPTSSATLESYFGLSR